MPDINEVTFASYRRALRSRNRSVQTINTYRKVIRELADFLDGADRLTATKSDMERFFEKRLAEVSATTVAIGFRSLRAFFGWCVEEEIIPSSPMVNMKEPTPDPG
ncbi:site-specific integrase [Actinoplanes auranticolor]|uniref:site-specific integrase n=1 Tax=Actinoplanes auranticolor TaxID=47988 RepID=UPI001BB3032F|nr:phage integrase N-terminal SAM-like domain-containing protein [Actinoplanes auranticolor]